MSDDNEKSLGKESVSQLPLSRGTKPLTNSFNLRSINKISHEQKLTIILKKL